MRNPGNNGLQNQSIVRLSGIVGLCGDLWALEAK